MRSTWIVPVNAVMAILFAVSAALQYNDPDPLAWVGLYCLAALSCLQYRRFRRDTILPLATAALAVPWAATIAPELFAMAGPADVFRSMDEPTAAAELAREFGGLVIVAGWMSTLVVVATRSARATKT